MSDNVRVHKQTSHFLPAELSEVERSLSSRGLDLREAIDSLSHVTEDRLTHRAVAALKKYFPEGKEDDRVERLLLYHAAHVYADRIEGLPVHADVKRLIRDEHSRFANPRAGSLPVLVESYPFTAASRIATLRRFPAGPMDWELSGFPRRDLAKVRLRDLPRVLWFFATAMRGFSPCFYVHVPQPPRNRSLVIEKQVLRAYYRMVRSLEMQPSVRGILASAWFHDPKALAEAPHLEWLNRPYREGGLITTIGPAAADSGFAAHNRDRMQRFERGELQYSIGVALWPREAAIRWANRHAELGG
jgi:hypothetical protein